MKQIQFIRFGGLSAVKQEAYKTSGSYTYHQPPVRYGIYCFPETAIERFLIGKDVFDNRRMIQVKLEEVKKDKLGYPCCMQVWRTEKDKEEFEKAFEDRNDERIEEIRKRQIYAIHAKPRKFSYTGNLWHHLIEYVPRKEVLAQKNTWVLTSYSAWLKAYQKDFVHTHFKEFKCSKDHLEVFIEKVN